MNVSNADAGTGPEVNGGRSKKMTPKNVARFAPALHGMDDDRRDDGRQKMVMPVVMIYGAGFAGGPDGLEPRYGVVVVPVVFESCATSLAREGFWR